MNYTQMVDPADSMLNFLYDSIITKTIHMESKYVTDSIGDDYKNWKKGSPVFIDAPTGTRKTTFIYEKIIPHAIANGKNVLLISNRIALNLQQKEKIIKIIRELAPESIEDIPIDLSVKDVEQYAYIGPICVATYQGLYSLLNTPDSNGQYPLEWYRKLQYVIFDEIHFLYSDALFNPICGQLLKKLPVVFSGVIRIYVTATPWEIYDNLFLAEKYVRKTAQTITLTPMESYIRQYSSYVPNNPTITRQFLYYQMDADYTAYRLHFFQGDSLEDDTDSDTFVVEDIPKRNDHPLIRLMNPLPSKTNKWLIFVDKKNLGQKLNKQLSSKGISVAYIDAKTRTPKKVWESLIAHNKVEEAVLTATAVIQNGVNIVDENAKNIAIFCTDRTSFIQELGRKRLAEGETVDLWVWVPNKEDFERIEKKILWHLRIAKVLNNDNNRFLPQYADAVRTLWDNSSRISYHALFYVNHQGQFRANKYAMEILERQLNFVQRFTHQYNPDSFQDTVEEWLGIKATEADRKAKETTLADLLVQSMGKTLTEEEFSPIRGAIIHMADRKNIAYIAPKRRDTASATTLNPMLAKLGLPYCVKKAKKLWTISFVSPTTNE